MNEINIFNEYKDIDFHKDHIIQLINLSLETAQYNQVKINLIFCDNDKLNSFKKEYFNDDVLTDIVTFPIKNDDDLEAEIYISVEMARINSKEFNVSLDNELSRLIIHGVLHLIGFMGHWLLESFPRSSSLLLALSGGVDTQKHDADTVKP